MAIVAVCFGLRVSELLGLLGKSSPLHEFGFLNIIANLARAKLVQGYLGH